MTKIVYTTGVFDMLHPWHINILKKAKQLWDKLIVWVQWDESVLKQKWKKPILSENQRKYMLESLKFVDEVFIYHDINQIKYLKKIKPDIMVQWEDRLNSWDRTQIIDYLKKNNIKLVLFPRTKWISTTDIREKIFVEEIIKIHNNTNIFSYLDIIDKNNIKLYEKNENRRTANILASFKDKWILYNPLLVWEINNEIILLDWYNRFAALKEIVKYIPVIKINYLSKLVLLRWNIHYFLDSENKVKNIFNFIKKNFELVKKTNSDSWILEISYLWKEFILKEVDNNLKTKIDILNRVVWFYKNNYNFLRFSEVWNYNNYSLKIKFNSFKKEDILNIVKNWLSLESWITYHMVNLNFLNLNFYINNLSTFDKAIKELEKVKKYKYRIFSWITIYKENYLDD